MSNTPAKATVDIFIDHTAAEASLKTLQDKADGFVKKIARAREEQDKLNKKIIEASEAGKDISKLKEKFNDAERAINSSRLQLEKLTAQQQKLTDQIDKKLGPTMRQQTALVNGLNNQLKFLPVNTEEFKNKLLELRQAEGVLTDMKAKVAGVSSATKEMAKNTGMITKAQMAISSFFGALAAGFAQNIIGNIVQLGKEAVQTALKAEGVKNAFDRLNRPGLLDELRKATKGTVSDLNLMTRAVQANNFQIPLETLGTMLQFAQRRARETGESVDYLVDSIVTGIARKSPLILDNLGINIQRIQKEFEKTGDFAKAAMIVVNEELSKAGPAVDLMADKVSRMNAKWENGKTAVGKFFLEVAEGITDGWDGIFNRQELVANVANRKMLVELKKSQDQTLETVRVFQSNYAKSDKQGKDKLVEQVKEQIKLTEFLENQAMIRDDANLQRQLNFKLDAFRKFIKDVTAVAAKPGDTIAGIDTELQALNEQLKNLKIGSKEFEATQKRIKELNKQLDAASGKTADENQRKAEEARKKAAADWERHREQLAQVRAEMSKMEKEFRGGGLSVYEKDLAKINERYGELIARLEKAKATDADIAKAKSLQQEEILLLDEQYQKKFLAFIAEQDEARAIQAMTAYEREIHDLEKLYAAQALLLKDNIETELALYSSLWQRKRDIRMKFQNKESEERFKELTESLGRNPRQSSNKIKESLTGEDLLRDKNLRSEETQKQMKKYIDLGNQAVDITQKLFNLQNSLDQAEIERSRRVTDEKQKNLKRMFDSNMISQQEYDRKTQQLQAEQEQREIEIKKRQFAREKALSIVQAVINGAEAITSILAQWPKYDFGISMGVAIAASSALTAAQIGMIAAQKPPEFESGGVLPGSGVIEGSRHSHGGIKMIDTRTGKVKAEVEGGEAILSRRFYRNNKSLVDSMLNYSMSTGGAPLPLNIPWMNAPVQTINAPQIASQISTVRRFANGGILPGAGNSSAAANSSFDQRVLFQFLQDMKKIMAVPVKAFVSITDVEGQQERIDEIRAAGSIR